MFTSNFVEELSTEEKCVLASQKHEDTQIYFLLYEQGNVDVRKRIASNSYVPSDFLSQICETGSDAEKKCLSRNSSLPDEKWFLLYIDESFPVKQTALVSRRKNLEQLRLFVKTLNENDIKIHNIFVKKNLYVEEDYEHLITIQKDWSYSHIAKHTTDVEKIAKLIYFLNNMKFSRWGKYSLQQKLISNKFITAEQIFNVIKFSSNTQDKNYIAKFAVKYLQETEEYSTYPTEWLLPIAQNV